MKNSLLGIFSRFSISFPPALLLNCSFVTTTANMNLAADIEGTKMHLISKTEIAVAGLLPKNNSSSSRFDLGQRWTPSDELVNQYQNALTRMRAAKQKSYHAKMQFFQQTTTIRDGFVRLVDTFNAQEELIDSRIQLMKLLEIVTHELAQQSMIPSQIEKIMLIDLAEFRTTLKEKKRKNARLRLECIENHRLELIRGKRTAGLWLILRATIFPFF